MTAAGKPQLIIATRNANKTAQIRLAIGHSFDIQDLRAFEDIPEIEETSETFEGNASIKAVEVSRRKPGYVLADDSGICVDALGGAPGVRSARYAGETATDAENNARLLRELKAAGAETPSERGAHYACAMVIAREGEVLHVANGRVDGRIGLLERGSGGFGYDPLFIPEGYQLTFAEMEDTEKMRFNHRGRALAEALDFLKITLRQ